LQNTYGLRPTDCGALHQPAKAIPINHRRPLLNYKSAPHANPLTLLPGNVSIQEYMKVRLTEQRPKPYNDVYGYARGDGMIQMLGTTA